MVPREAHNLQASVRIRPPQQVEKSRMSARFLIYRCMEDGFEEGGRGNICFPAEEGRAEGSSENRGFPRWIWPPQQVEKSRMSARFLIYRCMEDGFEEEKGKKGKGLTCL